MRLTVINCILLACTATTLGEERPRRHLHEIKEKIINKLFSAKPEAPPPDVRFYEIPGFNDVVIKAVPKGSIKIPAPVYETIPPNSHIGIVGSYLGTNTLNETYNALLGLKNLLASGILNGKAEVLKEVGLLPSKLIKPCAAPAIPLQPVPVLIQPPKVPDFPARYSYKQLNQDGSLTSYSSFLNLENGVRVTEEGKTLPLIIDRVKKIPVRLPVPVLPEMSKIVVSEVTHPATYSYQQIHKDGQMNTYTGLPSIISMPGPVVVTETGIPPAPTFLMDRIEKVAAIAYNPRAPIPFVPLKPVPVNAAIVRSPLPIPGPTGYSYSQLNVNGGMTTHLSPGPNGPVVVTDNGIPNGHGGNSFGAYGGGKMSYELGAPVGPVNVVEHPLPISAPPVPLPPNSFSYKQVGDGKLTTYTGSGIYEEYYRGSPPVVGIGMSQPIPLPHIVDKIDHFAAETKYNRPFLPLMPNFPVPTGYVNVPPIQPVQITSTPVRNPFNYKHIHNDGSVTSYSSSGVSGEGKPQVPPPADMDMPFPQGKVQVFESPMYSGPFPMNPVNPNAVKPSTPVSGSYSYKLVNSERTSHPQVGSIVDTFAPPPLVSMQMPAPIQGCIDADSPLPGITIDNPFGIIDPLMPVPLSYSYKQISHSNPNTLLVNVEDPVRDVKKINTRIQSPVLPPMAPLVPVNPFPAVNIPVKPAPVVSTEMPSSSSFPYKQITNQPSPPSFMEDKPDFIQPLPFASVPMSNRPASDIPESSSSSFSYKQITSQANPLPAQPVINEMRHGTSESSAPLPMINIRGPEIPKETVPSSYSYKQVTNQGVYEYSDEFATGVKTNLPPMNSQGNPGYINVVDMPIPSTTVVITETVSPMTNPSFTMPNPPTPVFDNPMPISSRPTINIQDSLANNPIIVPDSIPSSFSFKSVNPDGSTITVKNDGNTSIAVELGEATKTEESQVPVLPPAIQDGLQSTPITTSVPEMETHGSASDHARPMRRRLVRRKKPVVQRGDIPDSDAK